MKHDDVGQTPEDGRDAASRDAGTGRKPARRGEGRRRRERETRLTALRAAAVTALAAGGAGVGAGALIAGRGSSRPLLDLPGRTSAMVLAGIAALLGAVAAAGGTLAAIRIGALEPTRRRRTTGAGSRGTGSYVTPQDATTAGDAEVAQRVEHELFVTRGIPPGRVNVSADDGTVTLRGAAGSRGQATEILAATSRIAGVRGVRDELLVPGGVGNGRSGSPAGPGS